MYLIIPKSAISRKYETKSGIFGYCVLVEFHGLGLIIDKYFWKGKELFALDI